MSSPADWMEVKVRLVQQLQRHQCVNMERNYRFWILGVNRLNLKIPVMWRPLGIQTDWHSQLVSSNIGNIIHCLIILINRLSFTKQKLSECAFLAKVWSAGWYQSEGRARTLLAYHNIKPETASLAQSKVKNQLTSTQSSLACYILFKL